LDSDVDNGLTIKSGNIRYYFHTLQSDIISQCSRMLITRSLRSPSLSVLMDSNPDGSLADTHSDSEEISTASLPSLAFIPKNVLPSLTYSPRSSYAVVFTLVALSVILAVFPESYKIAHLLHQSLYIPRSPVFPASGNAMWYDKPGTSWEKEFLPIGNGFLGGM
jgi:hypothetical protein